MNFKPFGQGMLYSGLPPKLLLTMKLTTLFILLSLLQVSAATFGQKITLKAENARIAEVLQAIRQKSGYVFFYDRKDLPDTRISVELKDAGIAQALEQTLRNIPVKWQIVKNNVVLTRAEEQGSLWDRVVDRFFAGSVSGLVTDTLGQPLYGASVSLKGAKSYHALTDNYGKFSFDAIPAGHYDLDIRYIGYENQQRAIEIKGESLSLKFFLKLATSQLDQVQVIAYGSNTKRFSVGSTVTIDAATIENQPVSNVLLALQGQAPGLFVTPTGGAPGSAVKLQIRGQNSLRTQPFPGTLKYDQPLFIIDGVPFAPQNKSMGNLLTYNISAGATSQLPDNGISPFGTINPADIESISILKDADATSIYGSQGANGVVLITTKKGKPGKPTLSINVNSGVNVPTRKLEMMNTEQYLAIRKEAIANDKVVFTPTNANTYRDLRLFDQQRSVDWYDEFFNRTPMNTDIHATFSGGQANTSFIFSGGYGHTSYNFPGDFADNRFTLHSGYTYRSTDNKLSVQFGTDFAYNKNNASGQPAVAAAMSMAPNFPEMVDAQGNLIWKYGDYSLSYANNEYARLRQPANVQMYNLNTSARLAYQLIPNLTLSSNIGYNRVSGSTYAARPLSTLDPAGNPYISTANFTDNVNQAINVEPQLNYQRQIGAGVLSVLVGGTYKKVNTSSDYLSGTNYPNDDLLNSVAGAATILAGNTSNIYKYVAGFARIGYIHDQKYIVSVTGRRDGSSNFGPGQQFGNFGSVGLGWIFSEEKAIAKMLPFISFGKLSANYGTNGSDGIAPYSFQAFYTISPGSTTGTYQGVRAYMPSNLFNADYSWSVKKSWNAAIDLGFFKDRLLLNVTGYLNRNTEELLNYVLPSQTGFTGVLDNFAAILQNKGLEFSVSSTNVQNQHLKWTSTFNIGLNRNTVAAFPGLETSSYAQFYTIGESASLVQGFRYKGINQTTGLFEFYKANGQVTSSPSSEHISRGGDLQPLFNTDPKFSGGFGNTLSYKGLSISAFFQFTKTRGLNYLAGIYNYGIPGQLFNLPAAVIGKYWQKPGDVDAVMQRVAAINGAPTNAVNAFKSSDGAYGDASYLRLKTVSLSYTLPDRLLKHLGVKNCRIYMNAQNIFTITGYELGDPEQAGSLYTIPLQRNIVGGLSFNF